MDVERLVAVKSERFKVEYLGYLLWFTVCDLRVTREELAEVFSEAGLDLRHLPKPICPRDAFRRASKEGETKRAEISDGRFLNILIREVRMDSDAIIRHMVREVVDSKNVRLEYLPVAELRLDGNLLLATPFRPLEEIEMKALNAVKEAYEVERNCYNGRTIRDILFDILEDCRPVAVRPSGGVYFVPRQFEPTLRALQRFVDGVSAFATAGRKSRLWTVPVVDAEEHREMLKESLEDQVLHNAKSLVAEIAQIMQSGKKITVSLARAYAERVKELSALVAQYEDLLETEIVTAKANLELARAQAAALLEKVEVA